MDTNGTHDLYGTDQVIEGGTMITVPEAAQATGISPRAIRRALIERRLEGVQVAGRWLVDADDLDRYAKGAKMRQGNGAAGAPAPNGIGTDGAALVEELRRVLDRAVGAEVRAQIAEKGVEAMQAERDAALARAMQAEGRVIELENALAERARRRWWHLGTKAA